VIEPTPVWGFIQLAMIVILGLSGIHMAIVMGVVAVAFGILYTGGAILVQTALWTTAKMYTFTVLPLFLLMGELASECELGKNAFDAMYKVLWRIKGGLALALMAASAAFGACTGSAVAATAAMGAMAYPEMKKHRYDRGLSLGALANAGVLASLIPPSLMPIVYCILTEVPLGPVLIAGVCPGILLTILWMIVIYSWATIKPGVAPKTKETFSRKETIIAAGGLTPLVIIFAVIILGLFFGIFTPTEAGGVGAFVVILITLGIRRLNWSRFQDAMRGALTVTGMIGLLILPAWIMMHCFALTQMAVTMGDFLFGLGLSPMGMLWLTIAVVIVLGMMMDPFCIQILFVPLFYPLVVEVLGFDPIWYGVLFVVLMGLAIATPPVAVQIYVAHGLDPEGGTIGQVIKGCLPFWVAEVLLIALLVYFPQIATWLPGLMFAQW
jgi:tripartite ATP-independent transporter DctM subunit